MMKLLSICAVLFVSFSQAMAGGRSLETCVTAALKKLEDKKLEGPYVEKITKYSYTDLGTHEARLYQDDQVAIFVANFEALVPDPGAPRGELLSGEFVAVGTYIYNFRTGITCEMNSFKHQGDYKKFDSKPKRGKQPPSSK